MVGGPPRTQLKRIPIMEPSETTFRGGVCVAKRKFDFLVHIMTRIDWGIEYNYTLDDQEVSFLIRTTEYTIVLGRKVTPLMTRLQEMPSHSNVEKLKKMARKATGLGFFGGVAREDNISPFDL